MTLSLRTFSEVEKELIGKKYTVKNRKLYN